MRNEQDSRQLRRYVLGAATDEECDAIEREGFDRADAADRVSAAEDELIDDYLSGRLDGSERPRFERHYLSTPNHRRRVAIVRALKNAASTGQPVGARRPASVWWTIAGVAAALVILISGAMWMTRSRSGSRMYWSRRAPSRQRHRLQPPLAVPIAVRRRRIDRLPPLLLRRQRRSSSPYRSLQFSSAEIVNRQRSPCREESTS